MKKYTVDRLAVHVAQRYSVIVEANQAPQNYYMRAELDTQCFHGKAKELASFKPALAEVIYEDGEDTFGGSVAAKNTLPHCHDMNGESLVNYYPIAAPTHDDSLIVRVRFGRNGTRLRGFLNNQTYIHNPTKPTLMNWWSGQNNLNPVNFIHLVDKPKVIQVVIQGGKNGGEHPFHLVRSFSLIGRRKREIN
jgi:iron transport multicopper oxidase